MKATLPRYIGLIALSIVALLSTQCALGDAPANAAAAAATAAAPVTLCAPSAAPPTGAGVTGIFSPDSPPAASIRDLAWLVLAICAGIFVIVEGMIVYSIVRFRRRRTEATQATGSDAPPAQLYGSNPIELAWTVVPLLVVFVLGMVTVRTIREVQRTSPPAGAMRVVAIGHQWWWEYRYLDSVEQGAEVVVANELHVPVGRPVWLELESADVVHSWWVPKLAGKTDLVPNRRNETWFIAETPGVYLGQCAEYCGTQHANMLLRVYAEEPPAFQSWLTAQSRPPAEDAATEEGRRVFLAMACMNCHDVAGASSGQFGPNLTHLMSRETIGAGVAPLNRDTLRAWVDNPQALKPGANMPSLRLSSSQLDAVTAYLLSLK